MITDTSSATKSPPPTAIAMIIQGATAPSLAEGAGVVAGLVVDCAPPPPDWAPAKTTGVPDIHVGAVFPVIMMLDDSVVCSSLRPAADCAGDCDAFRAMSVAQETYLEKSMGAREAQSPMASL